MSAPVYSTSELLELGSEGKAIGCMGQAGVELVLGIPAAGANGDSGLPGPVGDSRRGIISTVG